MTRFTPLRFHRLARLATAGALAAGLAGSGMAVLAQTRAGDDMPHTGDTHDTMDAMARMNHDMMTPGTTTGDPDHDFVAMMIPHHQGAVDMARIYLRTGRDPHIRRMAQKIIADQEREMRDMRAWQARHPAP